MSVLRSILSRRVLPGLVCIAVPLVCGIQQAAAQSVETLPTIDQNQAEDPNSLPLLAAEKTRLENAIRNEEWSEAEKVLATAHQRHPDSAELLKTLARISFHNGNYWNTAIAYKKAEKIEPLDEQSRFSLAMAYVVLDHGDWAQPVLQSLVNEKPDNPLYLYWLARLDYDDQRFTEAIAKLRRVVTMDPEFLRAYNNLGLSLEAAGRHGDAVEAFHTAIEKNRKQMFPSAWPSLNLGTMLYRLGRIDEAEPYLREAVSHDPNLAQAQYQLGSLLQSREQFDAALEHLTRATELDPEDPKPHYALGRLYRRLGDQVKARAALETFSKLEKKRKERKQAPR